MDEYKKSIVKQLLHSLENPNENYVKGCNILHVAAQSSEDNSRVVQMLLDRGADVDSTTPDGHTPLHFAVSCRKRDTVDVLIEAGASVNSKDLLGRTALHFSICKGLHLQLYSPILVKNTDCDMWIVERLLRHPEINLDPVDQKGDTPLMCAVKERHSDAVKALLKKGANPNISNKDQRTPLHEALSAESSFNIVNTLLLNGAGIYSVDTSEETPMDILVRRACDESNPSFAKGCLWLIALRYHIRECLKQKLKQIPELYNYLNECCKEVRLMRELIIYDNVTLHDFALDCFQTRVEDPVQEIYIPVVEVLLSGVCKKYFELIFCRLSVPDLHSVLEISAGSSFFLDLLPSDELNFKIYDEIKRVYDETVELKERLLRFK